MLFSYMSRLCLFFLSILILPLPLFAEEGILKKDPPKKEEAPFLFIKTGTVLLNKEEEKVTSPGFGFTGVQQIGDVKPFMDPLLTAEGKPDVQKILALGVTITILIVLFFLITGVLSLVSVFRDSKNFPRNKIFTTGWTIFQKNRKFFVLYVLGQLLFSYTVLMLGNFVNQKAPLFLWPILCIGVPVFIIANGLLVRNIFSLLNNGNNIGVTEVSKDLTRYGLYILNGVMYSVMVLVPLLLAIVLIATIKTTVLFYGQGIPSVYPDVAYVLCSTLGILGSIVIALKTFFSFFFVIDKSMNPWQAVVGSWSLSKGKMKDLFLFWYLLLLINIAGFLTLFGVGALFTIPFTLCIAVALYKELSSTPPTSSTTNPSLNVSSPAPKKTIKRTPPAPTAALS